MKVAAIQMEHGPSVEENLDHARRLCAQAAREGATFALLPEYFFAPMPREGAPAGPSAAAAHAQAIRAAYAAWSREMGIVLAANAIEARAGGLANVGVVYDRGRLALEQEKVHPMPREAAAGVVGGMSLRAADVGGHRVGLLVCADILYPEAARVLALQQADLLLNPVMSPWRAEDDGKEARIAMYVARAYDAGAFVVKAAGFLEGRIAGRSLITSPWGVLAKAKAEFGEEVLVAELDFDRLRAFRGKQAQFPARRPEAYRDLL